MNKFLCSFLIIGFIGLINADETKTSTTSTTSSPPKKESLPQTSYVPSATNYQSSNSEAAILNNQAYDPTLYQTFVPQDAVQQYVSQYGGYTGQALEGFLIPTFDRDYSHDSTPNFLAVMKSFLPGPKILFAIVAKIVALLASAIGIVFFGGAITSFVCAFTPLCTMTIMGRPLALIKKETKDLVEKFGEEITVDRVKRAADLLKLAYDKYSAMQNKL